METGQKPKTGENGRRIDKKQDPQPGNGDKMAQKRRKNGKMTPNPIFSPFPGHLFPISGCGQFSRFRRFCPLFLGGGGEGKKEHIKKKSKQNFHGIVPGFWGGGVCLCVFLCPTRNDPKKTHKQIFGTHPVPGQSRKFVYVYTCFPFPELWAALILCVFCVVRSVLTA